MVMNSEINNNIALSSVTAVKPDTGPQNLSTNQLDNNPSAPTQTENTSGAKRPAQCGFNQISRG